MRGEYVPSRERINTPTGKARRRFMGEKTKYFQETESGKKYGVMASVKQQHFGNLAPTYFCNEVSFHVLKIFLLFSLLLFFTISSFCICYIAFSVICSRSLSVFLF